MAFFKYVIYAVLAVILYIVAKGFYDGSFDSETTIGEMEKQVVTEGKNITGTAKSSLKDLSN